MSRSRFGWYHFCVPGQGRTLQKPAGQRGRGQMQAWNAVRLKSKGLSSLRPSPDRLPLAPAAKDPPYSATSHQGQMPKGFLQGNTPKHRALPCFSKPFCRPFPCPPSPVTELA